MGAYNTYDQLPLFSYNCISYMLENNQLIWKLLKYSDADAWKKPDLTHEEKISLIYKGMGDETNYRVFMDSGQPDSWTEQCSLLRIHPYDIIPENRTVGTVTMVMEVYTHYHINHLSNYQTRNDTILQQLLKLFNGTDIGGLGVLFFDRLGSFDARMITAGQIPFKGKFLALSTKTA